ncbi:MAG: ABC-F family ATP-binding cassette domain-containing protein [Brevundimonas sp.]
MTLDRVAARTPDGHTLFDNLSLNLARERTGVVGRNGTGKTTLLRLIAGLADPAEGAVTRAGTVGWLAQRGEPEPDETVGRTLGVAEPLAILARVLAGEGTADDLAEADWSLEARLDTMLNEVGLAGLSTGRRTASLSGGEQTRLRLAALFLARPDLILLDEPTNNLDAEGREIVTEAIARWSGGTVVVSHDRALLRRMDRIVELSGLGAASYGGGYDLYAERKTAEQAAAERDLETAEQDTRRVARESQKAVEKKARRDKAGRAYAASGSAPKIALGAMARRAEESSARANRLATRLKDNAEAALDEAREKVERVRALDIPMPPTGLAAGRMVLALTEARWGPVLKPISLKLVGPERVAITGPNGAGKTTLLKLIAGALTPDAGRVERPVDAALLDQDAAVLRPEETLVEAYRRINPEATANEAHAALARFLFRNTAAQRTAGTLSGGERLRAALACVMSGANPPQLLILDEPTNHLDLDSIAAIEAALRAYDGALIVVSHDRDFLDAIGMELEISLD